jgi:6-phosphogluconate dehydrogenase (decarboxylating)
MSQSSDGRQQLAEARDARWNAGQRAATGRTAEERQQASAEHRELGKVVTALRNEFGDDIATVI